MMEIQTFYFLYLGLPGNQVNLDVLEPAYKITPSLFDLFYVQVGFGHFGFVAL